MKIYEWIFEKAYRAHASVENLATQFKFSPRGRRLVIASSTVIFTTLHLGSARAEGFADIFDALGRQAERIMPAVLRICVVVGVILVIFGLLNLYKKSQPGSHVEGKSIGLPILVGAMLGGVGWLFSRSGETVGMQSGSFGQLPQ